MNLAAVASGIDLGLNLLNIGDAYRRAQQQRQALRRMRLIEEAENARQEQIYGRTLDELGDFYGGTEGGAGRASRISTEQRIAEGGLRAGAPAAADAARGAGQAVERSLARRGVSGGVVGATLSDLEARTGAAAAERAAFAQEGARRERLQFAGGYRGPSSRSSELAAGFAAAGIPVDARGIGESLESLQLLSRGDELDLWRQAMRENRRRRTGAYAPIDPMDSLSGGDIFQG